MPGGSNSIYEVLSAAAAKWSCRPLLHVTESTALAYDIAPGSVSYSETLERADAWAARLSESGCRPGMRLAVLLENRPEFFEILLAANRLGASVVPVNPDLRSAELVFLLGHAEPALAISLASRTRDLRDAARDAGLALPVITPGEVVPALCPRSVEAQPATSAVRREAALLYTSGSTGRPKGCVLSNTYFLEAGTWYASLGGMASLREGGERMITPLPVFHMNALVFSFMAMLAVGGCLVALDRFHPRTWWRDVAASGATCLHYLGIMPSILMDAPPLPLDQGHSVRFGFGAGVDPKLHAAFEDRFGFPLIEAWAMTETGAGAILAANGWDRPVGQSCIGKPDPALEIRLAGDAGDPVPVGRNGELLVRRRGSDPQLGFFSEYYKDPEATERAWQGGWFHTGDIMRRDHEGYLYFVDRKKNLIRRSGENVAALEVEAVLMRHPAVRAAAVTGVPDRVRGEEVFALISAADPSPARAREIALWTLERMAYYKVPGFIAFVKELPLTATQKIRRRALKEMAVAVKDDPSTVDVTHLKRRTHA